MKPATTYLGLKLRTSLVPSASPLSEKLDNIKRMEESARWQWFSTRPRNAPSGPRYAASWPHA